MKPAVVARSVRMQAMPWFTIINSSLVYAQFSVADGGNLYIVAVDNGPILRWEKDGDNG